MKTACLMFIACLVQYARGHSWIACSDYAEKNAADWVPSKCRGFPRRASQYTRKESFGVDTGYDFRPRGDGPGCLSTYQSSDYSDEYPKAVYYRGQQVILAHPMKNHGADPRCTNQYIPDNGNAIYRGRVNTDTDLKFSEYKKLLVADLGVSPFGHSAGDAVTTYPKLGYQNAPKFCDNTDKSLGTYSFNIPRNLAAGKYTFVWRWSFNSKNDVYATCFDVEVKDTKAQRDTVLRQRGYDLYVPCGGRLSDNSAGSTVGCDGSSGPPPPPPSRSPGSGASSSAPAPVTTQAPPTSKPRVVQGRPVTVKITQMTGEVDLGKAANGVTKRYATVDFGCGVDANIWNGQTYEKGLGKVYKVLQKENQLYNGNLKFIASYTNPCNFLFTPPIGLVRDEM